MRPVNPPRPRPDDDLVDSAGGYAGLVPLAVTRRPLLDAWRETPVLPTAAFHQWVFPTALRRLR